MSSIIELSLYMQRFGHIFCGLRFVWARQFSLECPPLSLFGFCCLLLCWSSDHSTHFALEYKGFSDIRCVIIIDLKLWGSDYREVFVNIHMSASKSILEFATHHLSEYNWAIFQNLVSFHAMDDHRCHGLQLNVFSWKDSGMCLAKIRIFALMWCIHGNL